jgi:predicted NAD/FAD-dependent oxidoreductase
VADQHRRDQVSADASAPAGKESGTVVIGAGMAGMVCARRLVDAGVPVVVVDKSRGVGGRMATRRMGEAAAADHGAQYFTARSPAFVDMVDQWLSAGVVRPWGPGQPNSWCGVSSMTAIAKWMATGIDVRTATPVTAVEAAGDSHSARWLVHCGDHEPLPAANVVVTAPVPQVMELLSAGGVELAPADMQRLAAVDYDPCVAVMVVGDAAAPALPDGWLQPDHEVVAWVADNAAKGVSSVPVFTVHLTADASRAMWQWSDDAVVAEVTSVLDGLVPGVATPSPAGGHQVMRWRYARVSAADPQLCLVADVDGGGLLVVAGDAFGGSRVEQAALSGGAAADAVLAASPGLQRG